MKSQSNNYTEQTGQRLSELGTTRRAVLTAGGAAALGTLTGCSTLDGLIDRGAEELVGTTVSAPAAFYVGQAPTTDQDSDNDGLSDGDEPQFSVGDDTEVRAVPASRASTCRRGDFATCFSCPQRGRGLLRKLSEGHAANGIPTPLGIV